MPYLGNLPPSIGSYLHQPFSGNGSAPDFTLSRAAETNTVIVSIDGVLQIPTTAYSVVSGTTLRFTAAPPNSTTISVRHLGDQLDFGAPSDASVTNAKIVSGAAIDATKIADGTVTSAEFQHINTLSSNAQTQITSATTTANAALPKSGGTMTGDIAMGDNTLERPELKDYAETYNASSGNGTVTLDLSTGNVFQHTASGGNVAFAFSNPPVSGKAGSFTLKWIQDSTDRTITWNGFSSNGVKWAGGSAPDVTSGSGKIDVYVFWTTDAGANTYGFQSGADMS